MQLNFTKGAMPLYLQIQEYLNAKIVNGGYAYGELIPSELELEKMFKVSRITIRQAIADLEKEGYVKRQRGKGTTVTYSERIDESLCAIRSFTKEMQDRGKEAGTAEIKIERIKASDKVREQLKLNEGAEVYHLYRIRTADGEPIVVFETYINGDYPLPLDEEAFKGSMYDVFDKAGIGMPVYVHENFQAILADNQLASALNMKRGGAIFKRIRTAYNAKNEPIEYTVSYYRGDRYSYSVDLKNY